MKNFAKILKSFACILFTLFLLGTQQAKAQDCLAKLKEFNKVETGIPSARITEYEDCVTSLAKKGNKNQDLLKECYNKLIKSYDAKNNTNNVNEYKLKLQQLSSPAPRPLVKTPPKQNKNTTPLSNKKKDSLPKKKLKLN